MSLCSINSFLMASLANNSGQKRRIIIYTDILAAFIQVVFFRLDLYYQLPKSENVGRRLMDFIAEWSQGSHR